MKKICEFLNCKEEGIYPAPRSRKDITNYKYYCIEHIRDFNKSWNFFEGLTEEQFENEIRKSTTWDRPSWKFGTSNFNKKVNDTLTVKILNTDNRGLTVQPEGSKLELQIKKSQIAINAADARPSRFITGDRIDAAIQEIDMKKRKVSLSIKLLEEIS